jgi:hypothetical protein
MGVLAGRYHPRVHGEVGPGKGVQGPLGPLGFGGHGNDRARYGDAQPVGFIPAAG